MWTASYILGGMGVIEVNGGKVTGTIDSTFFGDVG